MQATSKQLNYIQAISDYCGVSFTGTTKEEASKFLDKWVPIYNKSMDELKLYNELQMELIDARRDW